MVGIEEDSVRYAHSGPSQRFLRGLRPLVSVGPLPLPVSAGGHASSILTINPPELYYINPPKFIRRFFAVPDQAVRFLLKLTIITPPNTMTVASTFCHVSTSIPMMMLMTMAIIGWT